MARGWSGYLKSLLSALHINLPSQLTNLEVGTSLSLLAIVSLSCRSLCSVLSLLTSFSRRSCLFVPHPSSFHPSHSLSLVTLFLSTGSLQCDFIAPSIIAILTVLLCFGVKGSARFNNVMVVVTLVIILFVICAGFAFADLGNWSPFLPFGVTGVTSGAAMIVFAYIGFDAVACTAEEVKNPKRDLPIGIVASLLISTLLYMLVSAAITLMVPYTDIDLNSPLATAFGKW